MVQNPVFTKDFGRFRWGRYADVRHDALPPFFSSGVPPGEDQGAVATYRHGWFKALVWFLFGVMTLVLFPGFLAVWFWRLSHRPPPVRGRRMSMLVLAVLAGLFQLLWLNLLTIDPLAGLGEAQDRPLETGSENQDPRRMMQQRPVKSYRPPQLQRLKLKSRSKVGALVVPLPPRCHSRRPPPPERRVPPRPFLSWRQPNLPPSPHRGSPPRSPMPLPPNSRPPLRRNLALMA